MIKSLQIALLILLSAAFAISLPTLWLGISPEMSLFSFLSGWQVVGSLATTLAIYSGVIAYVFGWNPQGTALHWFREKILLKALRSSATLVTANALLLTLISLETSFLYGFSAPPNNPVVDAIYAENYAAADRELASIELADGHIATLFFINDSIRQQFFSTSQNADKDMCRVYLNYFSKTRLLFTPIWHRYMQAYAQASCMQVLENSKSAVAFYEQARLYARWLGHEEERRTARKIAAIYFSDNNDTAGISGSSERYRYIISLVGADSNEAAQRMVGSSYYLLGEYSNAIETWSTQLLSIAVTQATERKKIINNIALAYTALHQNSLALAKIEEGLQLTFSVSNENERREQIRLLSTKTLVELNANSCNSARITWDTRNRLKQQELSKCSSLIGVQVLACGNAANDRGKIIESLLIGVGQDPSSFKDHTTEAVSAIIKQAEKTFSNCYLGLKFNADSVKQAVLRSMRDV
jgi:sulfur relay (sulfurtransferase) complex TusBCD TusD component (DsrE family)